MLEELDLVVLTHAVEDSFLAKGDIGTIVHAYSDGRAFEVEFVTGAGDTLAVLTLARNNVRALKRREILHVRELAQVAA